MSDRPRRSSCAGTARRGRGCPARIRNPRAAGNLQAVLSTRPPTRGRGFWQRRGLSAAGGPRDGDRWRRSAPNIGKESWPPSGPALAPDVWVTGVTRPGLHALLHWDGFSWTQSLRRGSVPQLRLPGVRRWVGDVAVGGGKQALPGWRATMSLRWSGSEWTQVGMPIPAGTHASRRTVVGLMTWRSGTPPAPRGRRER
jgi:hypothetical protein